MTDSPLTLPSLESGEELPIDSSLFLARAIRQARTASRAFTPKTIESCRILAVTVRALISERTSPVRYVDEDGRHVGEDDSRALPIRFAAFVERRDLVESLLSNWTPRGFDDPIFIHRCSRCDSRVVIDGNHRIAYLATNNRLNDVVVAFELSGPDWPEETPDMRRICDCIRVRRKARNN